MPVPDAAIFVAPHVGQGELLARMIDPSVTDEADPLSVDPSLDPYATANGFTTPPNSSHYTAEFVASYRTAQRQRVCLNRPGSGLTGAVQTRRRDRTPTAFNEPAQPAPVGGVRNSVEIGWLRFCFGG